MANIRIYKILCNLLILTIILGFIVLLWLCGLIALDTAILSTLACFIVFIVLPLIFRYSISIQRGFVFLNFVKNPMINNLKFPSKQGLYATRNFYLTYNDPDENAEVKLGVWHVLPNHIAKRFSKQLKLSEKEVNQILDNEDTVDETTESKLRAVENYIGKINNQDEIEKALFESTLKTVPGTIFLYLHGNTATRATNHRVELYKIFQRMGYHVIAFDYRSFGDSSKPLPTEAGIVRDAIAVFNYISSLTDNPIFLWGHSLGTGVSTHMLSDLNKISAVKAIKGVMLECPFSNIRDEVLEHSYTKLFKNLPWFEYTIVKPLYTNSLRFESTKHITEFSLPVCILHAEDDMIVPFKLGYKLYRSALESRNETYGPIEFHRFEKISNYGHKYIYKAPNIQEIIRNFVENYRNEQF